METRHVGATVDDLVNGAWIAVEGEDHGPISGEVFHKGVVIHTMWVQVGWIERHQIDDIDDAYFHFGNMLA